MAPLIDPMVKFDAFADEHESLERALSEMRELLSGRRDVQLTIETLSDLSEHVVTHFVHEEQDDGFFDNVIEQMPRLQRRAADLIEEHVSMIEALTGMQLFAAKNPACLQWWDELTTRFETFWKLFSRHECAEIEMVQDAFNEDMGALD